MKKLIVLILCSGFWAACAIGPNYKKPDLDVPADYKGALPADAGGNITSIGDQKWWEVFQDKKLQDLIRTALEQNYDVRIAADRVLEAQAQLNITGSYELPTVTAGVSPSGER